MTKQINKFWKVLPLFHFIHSDRTFDGHLTYKGFTFLFSIVVLPITIIPTLVGSLLK